MLGLNQDVTLPLVDATGIAASEVAVERPVVEPAVSAGHETTTETSFHPQDQDLISLLKMLLMPL